MSAVPAHLSECIQRRFHALETGGMARRVTRVCKERMKVLPLLGNQLTKWALRADGTVLSLDLDSVSHAYEEELELADLAVYLSSDNAAYVNGEVVVIDGGEWIGSGGEFNGLTRMPRAAVKGALAAMRGK